MKKIALFLFAVLLIMTFAGCGTAPIDESTAAGSVISADWKTAYSDFIKDDKYLYYGLYYTEDGADDIEPITVALHDMSGDGIPELIVYNGCEYEAEASSYVFTFDGSKVKCEGDMGFRIGFYQIPKGDKYCGLFWLNGNMGVYDGFYYTVAEGSVKKEHVTTAFASNDDYEFYKRDNPNTPAITDVTDNYLYAKYTSDEALYKACIESDNYLKTVPVSECKTMSINSFAEKYGY